MVGLAKTRRLRWTSRRCATRTVAHSTPAGVWRSWAASLRGYWTGRVETPFGAERLWPRRAAGLVSITSRIVERTEVREAVELRLAYGPFIWKTASPAAASPAATHNPASISTPVVSTVYRIDRSAGYRIDRSAGSHGLAKRATDGSKVAARFRGPAPIYMRTFVPELPRPGDRRPSGDQVRRFAAPPEAPSAVNLVLRRPPTMAFELTRRLIEERIRREAPSGSTPQVLHRRFAAPRSDAPPADTQVAPTPPVLRSPPTATSPALPTAAASMLDVERLTDQVVRKIDDRITAYRERMGRAF